VLSFEADGETVQLVTRLPSDQNGSGRSHWSGKLTAGTWHDFVLHVKWAPEAAVGFVELWFDGKRVVRRTSLATMNTDSAGAPVDATFVVGLARQRPPKKVERIYVDGLVAATDRTDVADPAATEDSLTSALDADGNYYPTVTLGAQVWMAENLKTTRYSDGTVIPNVADNRAWGSLQTGALCYYNNDQSFKDTYGALYNWHAAVDTRNLCPKDWRVPSDNDWGALVTYLGGSSMAGGKLKETGTTHWTRNIDASNTSGFRAIPGGDRHDVDGLYYDLDYLVYLWSSTESSSLKAWTYEIGKGSAAIRRPSPPKKDGFSVRCMRDYKIPGPDPVRDNEGNQYKVVRIGSQTWMAENLRATRYGDGTPIPNVTGNEQWLATTTGAYCWYDNDPALYRNTYGTLYNWYAVADTRDLCPADWHVPSDAEWATLVDHLGGRGTAGNRLKDAGSGRWHTSSLGPSGFAALPGGFRYVHKPIHQPSGAFDALGYTGLWWTATERGGGNAWFEYLDGAAAGAYGAEDSKRSGYAVRCIKD
jgi:uncharacterized protein (TIGR02145 family)